MKICQIMLSQGFGGAERLFVDLCLALTEVGHDVLAICHPEFQGMAQLSQENVQFTTLKVHMDWSPLAQFRLQKAIGRFRPQVVHCHLARSASVAGSVCRKAGVPVVANLHNYVDLKYYRKIDHFFPGTQDQKRFLIENDIPAHRVTVVPHFTRLKPVDSVAPYTPDAPVFVSFGRFVRKKGFHILLKALKMIRDQGTPARLVLGGDGPEKESLQRMIKDLELQQAVEMQGWVEDVRAFLSKAPFFVLPSLDEPFGIVILEAMSQGKVILSTATQGPREILDDSTAYLFPTGDARALAQEMQKVCEAPEEALQKAVRALEKFRENYSTDMVLPAFVAGYQSLGNFSGNINR